MDYRIEHDTMGRGSRSPRTRCWERCNPAVTKISRSARRKPQEIIHAFAVLKKGGRAGQL